METIVIDDFTVSSLEKTLSGSAITAFTETEE